MTAPFLPAAEDLIKGSHDQDYEVIAHYEGWPGPMPLDVSSLTITWSENRAPRVSASMNVNIGGAASIDRMDPRLGVRIEIKAGYVFPDGTRDVHTIANLVLRDRRVQYPSYIMSIIAESDESLLIDNSPVTQQTVDHPHLLTAMENIIRNGVPDATIVTTASRGDEYVYLESVTDRWNVVQDLADRVDAQVYDDGLRVWHIEDQAVLNPEDVKFSARIGVSGTTIEMEHGQSRDEWFNAVHLHYSWEDVDGNPKEVDGWALQKTGTYRIQGPAGKKTFTQSRNIPAGANSANAVAQSLLRRFMSRSRQMSVRTLAAYWLRPGDTVSIQVPDEDPELFTVSEVIFDVTEGTMQLTTRQPDEVVNTRVMRWAGYEWSVRPTQPFHGPGPNAWSDSEDAAWIDAQGHLHLQIYKDATDIWRAVELEGPHLGYGKYTWTINTNPQNWPIEPVLGLFTYDDADDGSAHYRELDIEFSKWNFAPEPSRNWFSVQPVIAPVYSPPGGSSGGQEWETREERIHDNRMTPALPYVGSIYWQKNQVYFEIHDANGLLLGEHQVYDDGLFEPGNETTRMNLWLLEGRTPSDGQPIEVELLDFQFTPGVRHSRRKASETVLDFTELESQQKVALKVGSVEQGSPISAIVAGKVQVECTSPFYSIAYTGSVFDLENSHVSCRVDGVPEVGDFKTEAIWEIRFDDEAYLNFFLSGGHIYAQWFNAGVKQSYDMGEYDPVAHKYWRVRESNETAYFETSPDHSTWTTQHSLAHGLGKKIYTLRLRWECGYFGDPPATTYGSFKIGAVNHV